MNNPIVNSRYLIYKKERSIMLLTYKKDLAVDLDTAKNIVKERLKIYDGRDYPTLVDIRYAKLFTKEARDYFAIEGVKGMKALAIVTGGYLTVVTANLFITFSKPLVPTRAFRTQEAALKWLQQFVIQKENPLS